MIRRRASSVPATATAATVSAPPASHRAELSAVDVARPQPGGRPPVPSSPRPGDHGRRVFGFTTVGKGRLVPPHHRSIGVRLGRGEADFDSPSGSLTDTRNRANWSDEMPVPGAAVQVTAELVPAATLRSRRAVQPDMTSVRADATSGSSILNCVVNAPFSDSPGTRKVTTAVCPGEALSDSARTWADADAVPVSSPMETVAPVTATASRAREAAPVVNLIRCGFLVSLGWSVSGRG